MHAAAGWTTEKRTGKSGESEINVKRKTSVVRYTNVSALFFPGISS
jgi:hypothetical protein